MPPPLAIAAATWTTPPVTGLPAASCTCTTGWVAKGTPLCAEAAGWVVITSCAGAPAVSATTDEVSIASAPAVKTIRYAPVVPKRSRLPKLAAPAAEVATVVVPPSVAPAPTTAAVTCTFDWATVLPKGSQSCTTGCCANATPLCALPEGWVATCSRVAAPAAAVALKVIGLLLMPAPAAVAVTVLVTPATVPRVQAVSVAMPLAPVATETFAPLPLGSATLPPPAVTWKRTVTPCTGLLFASVTFTDGFWVTPRPAVPAIEVGLCATICDGVAEVPVALNWSWARPEAAAVS